MQTVIVADIAKIEAAKATSWAGVAISISSELSMTPVADSGQVAIINQPIGRGYDD